MDNKEEKVSKKEKKIILKYLKMILMKIFL